MHDEDPKEQETQEHLSEPEKREWYTEFYELYYPLPEGYFPPAPGE